MGVLSRINTVIKANLNEVLDRMSDPAKEIDLLVHDMESAHRKAKAELVSVSAAAKLAARHCQDLEADVARWQERAEKALHAGDEGLARAALQEKMEVNRRLAEARAEQAEQERYSDELRRSLGQFEDRLKVVQGRRETVKQQLRAERGQDPLAEGQAFKDYQRIESAIDALEIEGQLTEELDGRDAATEARFARLEQGRDAKVEDALAELKRKLDEGG